MTRAVFKQMRNTAEIARSTKRFLEQTSDFAGFVFYAGSSYE